MMLIHLPNDSTHRRAAYTWLSAEKISHMRLFQSVQIDDARDADRFKRWLTARKG